MFGFLIAFVAGFLTPHIERPVARPLQRMLAQHIEIEEGELRLLAFAIMLVGTGVLCAVFNTGSPLGVAIAATLGYFAMRILAAVQRMMEKRGD